MIKAIRETGRVPVQRNTFYEPIRIMESLPSVPDTKNGAEVPESDLVAK
jgi:hypothetical protein